ncbi:MAG: phage tail tape measure protein [Brevundimonas sp.]
MNDPFEADGLAAVPERAAEAAAAAALEGLREPADRAASAIGEAFDRAGESLARSLARAAADGEVSLAELARAVLAAVNSGLGAGAGSATGGGLGAALAAAVGSLFGGTRAESGPVSAGAAYLVGERGPEVFRPAGGGTIEPVSGPGVTINVSVDGGAPALLRSEAQIAQMLARAVALGARRL